MRRTLTRAKVLRQLLVRDCFDTKEEAIDDRLQAGVLSLRKFMTDGYNVSRITRPDTKQSEIRKVTTKMLGGTPQQPDFKCKGGESRCLLPMTRRLLELHGHLLGDQGELLLQAARHVERFFELMHTGTGRYSDGTKLPLQHCGWVPPP